MAILSFHHPYYHHPRIHHYHHPHPHCHHHPVGIITTYYQAKSGEYSFKIGQVMAIFGFHHHYYHHGNHLHCHHQLSITRSFLELQSPDFAWKFVWTVQTNTKIQNTKIQKM